MNFKIVKFKPTCCVICIPINGSELLFSRAFSLLSLAGGSLAFVTLESKSILRNTLTMTRCTFGKLH